MTRQAFTREVVTLARLARKMAVLLNLGSAVILLGVEVDPASRGFEEWTA